MEVKKLTLFSLFLLLLLLASQKGISGVEDRVCKSPSLHFHGPCLSDTNCARICVGEGFSSGDCEGLRRICMCQKIC